MQKSIQAPQKTATTSRKLNILIFEDPDLHAGHCAIGIYVKDYLVRHHNHNAVLVKNIGEALAALKAQKFDLLWVHHSDQNGAHLEMIRGTYPEMKRAGYSGEYFGPETTEGTIAWHYEQQLKKYYHFLSPAPNIKELEKVLRLVNGTQPSPKKLNVLVFEVPYQHKTSIGEDVTEYISGCLGHNAVLVKGLNEALSELNSKKFDLAFIHHSGYDDIDAIKGAYPEMKYAVHTGALPGFPSPPSSVAGALEQEMKKHYDMLVYSIPEGIDGAITSLLRPDDAN